MHDWNVSISGFSPIWVELHGWRGRRGKLLSTLKKKKAFTSFWVKYKSKANKVNCLPSAFFKKAGSNPQIIPQNRMTGFLSKHIPSVARKSIFLDDRSSKCGSPNTFLGFAKTVDSFLAQTITTQMWTQFQSIIHLIWANIKKLVLELETSHSLSTDDYVGHTCTSLSARYT